MSITIRFIHCGELMGLLKQEGSIQTYGCEKCRYETSTDINTWGFIGYTKEEVEEQ